MELKDLKTYVAKSTSSNTMNISPLILRETATTRLLFFPKWASDSQTPLRGGFVFQRKSPLNEWQNIPYKSLTTLKKDEEYSLNLEGKEVLQLLSELKNISKIYEKIGFRYGQHAVQVLEDNVDGIFIQISDPSKKELIKNSLKKLNPDDFENLDNVIRGAKLDRIIEIFKNNLSNSDESFWEKFFEENPEVLQQIFAFPVMYLNGETYLGGKNSKGRQGQGGIATDFLCMNGTNNSFAVVEIKTPSTGIIGSQYRGSKTNAGENITYAIDSELTGGLVQMENQINIATECFQNQIGKDFVDLNLLDPIGVLIAGNKENLKNKEELKSFNLFRKSLGKNQIYTFDEILSKLKLLKKLF